MINHSVFFFIHCTIEHENYITNECCMNTIVYCYGGNLKSDRKTKQATR
jgi:hypothetical protein